MKYYGGIMEDNKSDEKISKICIEILNVIKRLDIEMQNKIPKEIKNMLYNNIEEKNKNNLDISIYDLDNLMEETKGILSILWSNYLCSEEEREKWKEYDEFSAKIGKS